MPIFSVKHIMQVLGLLGLFIFLCLFITFTAGKNAPDVTSTLSGLWSVQLKPLDPCPLVSPFVRPPCSPRPLMLESHELESVFCHPDDTFVIRT